jgi:glycosyltransferase involved in cell wall biosynthesis
VRSHVCGGLRTDSLDSALTNVRTPGAGTDPAAIVLISYGIGGGERRFLSLFKHLVRHHPQTALFVNATLHDELVEHGLLAPSDAVVILHEPRWLRQLIRKTSQIRLVARALMALSRLYLIRALRVALSERPHLRIVHTALDGIRYVPLLKQIDSSRTYVGTVTNSDRTFLHRPQLKRGFAACDYLDCLDRGIADLIAEWPSVDPARVGASPGSFASPACFPTAPVTKRRRVVYSSRLIAPKNPQVFMDAVEICGKSPEAADVEFLILGSGELLPALQERAERARQQGINIRTLGFVSDTTPILRETLVYVQTLDGPIPASQGLLEAMANECAVVATHFDGVEAIVPEGTGLTPRFQVSDFADKICWLLANPAEAITMGKRAREHVAAHFSVEAFERYILQKYREAQANPKRTDRAGAMGRTQVFMQTVMP